MDLNKLYYFYVVSKYEHVTKASEELHVSQPAVTKTIKILEENLGVELFYKIKRNIKLTPYGKYLKSRLEGIFQMLEEVPTEIENMKNEMKNVIKLNVLSASTIVTEAIVAYKRINPNAVFQVIQNEEALDCDISVFTKTDEYKEAVEFKKFEEIVEEIYLAVPKGEDCLKNVNLRDFSDYGFVNLAGSKQFRVMCDRFCAMAGLKQKIVFESDSIIAVKNLISAGAGIGFWPAFSWGETSRDIKLLPISEPVCNRELMIGLHKNLSGSTVAEDFYEYLIKFMKDRIAKA